MKLCGLAAILSTCCFLQACKTVREVEAVRPDLDHPARLECEAPPAERPAIPAAHVVDWNKVQAVVDAKREHDLAMAAVIERNVIISEYLLALERDLFICASNMQWWRDYWAAMPKPED